MSEKELEYNPDFYTLVDEEGNEQEFELLDILEVDGQRYFALVPVEDENVDTDEDGELIVLKSKIVDDDEMMVTIDDDDEYQRIGNLFIEKLTEFFEQQGEQE